MMFAMSLTHHFESLHIHGKQYTVKVSLTIDHMSHSPAEFSVTEVV